MLFSYKIRFHVSASSGDNVGRSCALCLDTLPPKTDSKVCKKCYEKHNNEVKYGSFQFSKDSADIQMTKDTPIKSIVEPLPEHYCNLCQKSFGISIELEEHLIEHSFRGCEERGYNCYICSAIFTLPCGLHQHMIEHGPSYRPYDCNLCAKKFYFRAALENHLIDHENGRITTPSVQQQPQADTSSNTSNDPKQLRLKHERDNEYNQIKVSNENSDNEKDKDTDSRQQNIGEANADDDDEYIEVEQIGEGSSMNHESRIDVKTQHAENIDKYDESQHNDNV